MHALTLRHELRPRPHVWFGLSCCFCCLCCASRRGDREKGCKKVLMLGKGGWRGRRREGFRTSRLFERWSPAARVQIRKGSSASTNSPLAPKQTRLTFSVSPFPVRFLHPFLCKINSQHFSQLKNTDLAQLFPARAGRRKDGRRDHVVDRVAEINDSCRMTDASTIKSGGRRRRE